MSEYHVGCGAFGILAGTLNKDKTLWKDKSYVTEEAVFSVANYLLVNGKEARFDYKGKGYVMRVMLSTEGEHAK